jgi:hypothetical protein
LQEILWKRKLSLNPARDLGRDGENRELANTVQQLTGSARIGDQDAASSVDNKDDDSPVELDDHHDLEELALDVKFEDEDGIDDDVRSETVRTSTKPEETCLNEKHVSF